MYKDTHDDFCSLSALISPTHCTAPHMRVYPGSAEPPPVHLDSQAPWDIASNVPFHKGSIEVAVVNLPLQHRRWWHSTRD